MKLNFLQHIHRKALNLFIETFVILTLSHLLPRCEVSSCNLFTAITYTDLPWPPWSSSWELMRCCPPRYNLQQVLPKTELSALTLFVLFCFQLRMTSLISQRTSSGLKVKVTQSCLTLHDPTNCSTPGFPVHHHLLEPTQTHVHPAISYSVVPFSSCP